MYLRVWFTSINIFALDVCYPCFYVNCAFMANFAEIRLPFNEVEGLGDFFRASNDK